VLHRYNGVCWHVFEAAKIIFKRCGMEIRNQYQSGRYETDVDPAKMKEWLTDIRHDARGKRFVVVFVHPVGLQCTPSFQHFDTIQ